MEAKELRIGNLVRSKTHKTNIEINQIDGYNFYSTYEPIELTEEWICKTNLIDGIGIHNDYFSGIVKIEYNESIGLWELFIGETAIKFILYVHRLKNAFYEITDTELTITEKELKI